MHSKVQIDGIRHPALLKTSNGKCVCVQTCRPSQSLQLVAENLHGNDPGDVGKVTVYDILYNEARPCMAFCFELGDKAVFPVVTDGKEVKFEALPKQEFTKETFKEKFLFQWGEAGTDDWRSLKSVANPNMYLFVEEKMARVTIKPVAMPYFRIDEKGENVKMRDQANSALELHPVGFPWSTRAPTRDPLALSTKLKYRPKRKPKKKPKKSFVKSWMLRKSESK